jgi:hypothetical protein
MAVPGVNIARPPLNLQSVAEPPELQSIAAHLAAHVQGESAFNPPPRYHSAHPPDQVVNIGAPHRFVWQEPDMMAIPRLGLRTMRLVF